MKSGTKRTEFSLDTTLALSKALDIEIGYDLPRRVSSFASTL